MARIWILGGGVIGAGWAVAYGAAGHDAVVIDPAPDSAAALRAAWNDAQPALAEMGRRGATSRAPGYAPTAAEAGAAPDLVQECLPGVYSKAKIRVSSPEKGRQNQKAQGLRPFRAFVREGRF